MRIDERKSFERSRRIAKVAGLIAGLLAPVLLLGAGDAQAFSPAEVYRNASSSVVLIFGFEDNGAGSSGTGSILTTDGLVLTNNHVIASGDGGRLFSNIVVYFKPSPISGDNQKDLKQPYLVDVIARDAELDLALLRVKNPPPNLRPLEIGDSEEVDIGEDVAAIGHPGGGGLWTLTTGTVSSKRRDAKRDIFQTDTAINPGNSGGPLLDEYARLVGVNTFVRRVNDQGLPLEGLNYSLRSSLALRWVNQQGVTRVAAIRRANSPAPAPAPAPTRPAPAPQRPEAPALEPEEEPEPRAAAPERPAPPPPVAPRPTPPPPEPQGVRRGHQTRGPVGPRARGCLRRLRQLLVWRSGCVANLLPRKHAREPFPGFDERQRARFEERARCLGGLDWPAAARSLARIAEAFPIELEELEAAPTLAAADDLLDRIDRARRPLLTPRARSPLVGDWLCYLPGRSLSTGEAEIASRGFFDVLDRPPPGLWLEAIGRHAPSAGSVDELAILCFVPEIAKASARAGREACGTGSLATVEQVSPALSRALREIDLACVRRRAGSERID